MPSDSNTTITHPQPNVWIARRGRSSMELCVHASGYLDWVGVGPAQDLRALRAAILRARKVAA